MSLVRTLLANPALRLYLLAHVCILMGAWLMDALHSMVPMALGASAALMLSVPLLRQLIARFAACRPRR